MANRGSERIVSVSKTQLKTRVERAARRLLGVDGKSAFRMLASGKLAGTPAEIEFQLLKAMLAAK